jgi:hypothetical protein
MRLNEVHQAGRDIVVVSQLANAWVEDTANAVLHERAENAGGRMAARYRCHGGLSPDLGCCDSTSL